MQPNDAENASPRALSLLRFAMMSTAGFVALVVLVTVVLIGSSSLFYGSTKEVVRDVRSQTIAGEVELSLLTYQRISNLRALTGEKSLDGARAPLVTAMRDLLRQAEAYVGSPAEKARVDEVARQLDTYLEERRRLEAAGLEAPELIRRTQPQLNATVEDLEALRELNAAQVRRAEAEAERWADVALAVGIGAGSVLVVGLLLGLVGIHRYVLGPLFELHGAIARFHTGDTGARVAVGGFREVSELERGYNRMADALAQQRQAQLTFLAGVAHDLRNPLSGLKLGIHALDDLPRSPDSRSRTRDRLDRQVDRLARMVDDLLDATRIEAGILELRPEEVDLCAIVEDMVALYEPTSPGHEVTGDTPAEPVIAFGDPLRIEQVVSNLLSNAIKFSPNGGPVAVSVRAENDHALLVVSDRGVGIARDDLPMIFQPFQRRRTELAPGAGLGLSVVRRIVVAHGGTIDVESQPGIGSTFRVRLPRAPTG